MDHDAFFQNYLAIQKKYNRLDSRLCIPVFFSLGALLLCKNWLPLPIWIGGESLIFASLYPLIYYVSNQRKKALRNEGYACKRCDYIFKPNQLNYLILLKKCPCCGVRFFGYDPATDQSPDHSAFTLCFERMVKVERIRDLIEVLLLIAIVISTLFLLINQLQPSFPLDPVYSILWLFFFFGGLIGGGFMLNKFQQRRFRRAGFYCRHCYHILKPNDISYVVIFEECPECHNPFFDELPHTNNHMN